MMPAVVAFETEKLYENAESSLAIQPSCLKRPIIVVHVDAFAFQPCTNRMIGFGCRGGALLARGSPGSVMELHAPSTMRDEPASERRADRIDESRVRGSWSGNGTDDATP